VGATAVLTTNGHNMFVEWTDQDSCMGYAIPTGRNLNILQDFYTEPDRVPFSTDKVADALI